MILRFMPLPIAYQEAGCLWVLVDPPALEKRSRFLSADKAYWLLVPVAEVQLRIDRQHKHDRLSMPRFFVSDA
jgi:hypothetical protein